MEKGFKFQLDVCNGCQNVLIMSLNVSDIAILNIHGVDYHFITSEFVKTETINLMQNMDFTLKKAGNYKA